MIDLLKFDLNGVKTVINPIFGLPTPHQQSVNRIISRLSDLEKTRLWVGFEPVDCQLCRGSGEVSFDDFPPTFCPSCNGDGVEYQYLGESK